LGRSVRIFASIMEDEHAMAPKKDESSGPWKKDDKKGGPPDGNPFSNLNPGQFRFSMWYFVAAIVLLLVVNAFLSVPRDSVIEYSAFKEKIRSGEIKRVEIDDQFLLGIPVTAQELSANRPAAAATTTKVTTYRTARVDDPQLVTLMDEKGVEYFATVKKDSPILTFLMSWVLPFAFLAVIWRFMFKRMGNMGNSVMSFGRNKAQIVAEGDTGVRFADVAGCEEAKRELVEVVDFLKNPGKYTAIGGRIPTGVLLVGSPGTGKTMLAKAVAGEAAVPFFRMSGSDFVEMFVGVGAARVRDLFKQAREKSPCIIFIDELDAIGRSRVNAIGGNDERETTLNQLLVEMDGFDSRTGVIILAATNRPEILDAALLRPGRFDRQIVIDKPDLAGREAILGIHVKNVKLEESVDLKLVARSTPGLSGADLANIVNEAALHAVRGERDRVSQKDFSDAIEKVMTGLERKTKVINPKEREAVAYHEAGHAVVAHFTEGSDPVEKISIIPRGIGALGFTLQLPTEERYLMTEEELYRKIDVLLGGRAAEKNVFGVVSTGASNDLARAADVARKMITEYGMSTKFRNVYLPSTRSATFLGNDVSMGQREYSESTQQYIDEETARIINDRYEGVLALLDGRRPVLDAVAKRLLEVESLTGEEFRAIASAA
jgi:cell division protease FtsH